MSYKEKFNASQYKAQAHNIATKILRDLTDLRSKVEQQLIQSMHKTILIRRLIIRPNWNLKASCTMKR